MDRKSLLDLISSLSSEQQVAVEEFVRFLKESTPKKGSTMAFREALDVFTREHGELLRRLAQ